MQHGRGLLIFGFGGHARSVGDVALSCGYESLLFVDQNAQDGELFLCHQVVRNPPKQLPDRWACIAASGDGDRRYKQLLHAKALGWPIATLISPLASIGAGADIGRGCVVGHHAHVGPLAKVGEGCIINTGASVEHDCVVGEYSHISVNATLAGSSKFGSFGFLGAGATVVDKVSVTNYVQIGAGGVVTTSLDQSGLYVGVPVHNVKVKGAF